MAHIQLGIFPKILDLLMFRKSKSPTPQRWNIQTSPNKNLKEIFIKVCLFIGGCNSRIIIASYIYEMFVQILILFLSLYLGNSMTHFILKPFLTIKHHSWIIGNSNNSSATEQMSQNRETE